jgi:glycolate oxidase iron-sulfur subunit
MEEAKLLACVHCGLCLEACPTYVHTGDENDSPRGRIYLMRAVAEERLRVGSPTFARHINRCLGCRACEAACPAGVEYGHLLEAARETISETSEAKSRPTNRLLKFILRRVWLYPKRLRFALRAAQLARDTGIIRLSLLLASVLPFRLRFALALLESSRPPSVVTKHKDEQTTSIDGSDKSIAHGKASLFTGCVMDTLFTRVNRATARVLKANGYALCAPREQVCCGALHLHAGDAEGARTLARRNLDAFADTQNDANTFIITNAGGCGAMLASYDQLLADDPVYAARARDFSRSIRDIGQQLIEGEIKLGATVDDSVVTYDASCHLLYGQRAASDSLEAMRRAIPDLRFIPLEGSEVCCGGAGIYNLIETELSARVLDEKLRHVKATGAQVLATGNPGCHMQIAAGARLNKMNLRVCHPVELIDEAYRRSGFYNQQNGKSVRDE